MKPYKVTIRTRDDRALATRAIERCPPGYKVTFTPPTRTLPQNSQLWALLDEISEQVTWHGEKLSSEEWKDILTAALKKQRVVPGIDGGVVVIGAHTSHMTVEELSDLLELTRAFAAEKGVKFGDDIESLASPGGEREEAAEQSDAAEGPASSRTISERVQ